MQRIADPQLSPDGKWIAYEVGVVDLGANKTVRHIWMVSAEGGEPRQLTRGDGSDTRPRWSPDVKSLAFISTRGGNSQVWILPLDGGDPRPLTSLSTEADGVTWATHGDTLLFTSQVYPDCLDEACNAQRLKEAAESKVKAQIFTELLFRHWDSWRDGRYTHLFAISAKGGTPRDLTPGASIRPRSFSALQMATRFRRMVRRSATPRTAPRVPRASPRQLGPPTMTFTSSERRAANRSTLPATIRARTHRHNILPTAATSPTPRRRAMAMNPTSSACAYTIARPEKSSTLPPDLTSG